MPNSDPADTRRRILDSAAVLFAKRGFNGTVTHDISHLAEVNESTLFRHFSGKLDVFLATLDAKLEEVCITGDSIAQIIQAANSRTALEKTLEAVAAVFAKDSLLHRLIQFGMLELPEQIEPILRDRLYKPLEIVSRSLAPWIRQGPAANLGSKAITLTFLAVLMNYQVIAETFAADVAHPLDTFRACAELCGAAGIRFRGDSGPESAQPSVAGQAPVSPQEVWPR
jgi:AcrR family transcriptional regulator